MGKILLGNLKDAPSRGIDDPTTQAAHFLVPMSSVPRNLIHKLPISLLLAKTLFTICQRCGPSLSVPLSLHNAPSPLGSVPSCYQTVRLLARLCYSECGVGCCILLDGGLQTPTRALAGLRGGGWGAGQACVSVLGTAQALTGERRLQGRRASSSSSSSTSTSLLALLPPDELCREGPGLGR